MAKQCGPIKLTGTIDNLCFYELEGEYYVRMKSSLDGKRVKQDPAFKGLMWYADMLGKASQLASVVYRELCGGEKIKGLYPELKRKAYRLLREGVDAEEVLLLLSGARVDKLTGVVVDGCWLMVDS